MIIHINVIRMYIYECCESIQAFSILINKMYNKLNKLLIDGYKIKIFWNLFF